MKGWESLGYDSYNDYLLSEHWGEIKKYFLEHINYCQVCLCNEFEYLNTNKIIWTTEFIGNTGITRVIPRMEQRKVHNSLQVHHLNYNNCGCETKYDCIVVCMNCHKLLHKVNK